MDDIDYNNSKRTKIVEIILEAGQLIFEYEYDFGDCWQHDVVFEGRMRQEKEVKYPRCIDGSRACPPEDIGGIYGYVEFCEAIADPKHERHKELRRWIGREFDPEAFDAAKATMRMQKGLPKWR